MAYMDIQFDGDTVLCRVCGDKASGFHYGVHACEGCKGFFRRSIQQKIQYRPCLKNQQCNIMRVNRNRCQYCRLKKCISVGMSRDAVRFGRVPKKEKAKIIEQMQRVNIQSQGHLLALVLENEGEVVQKIIHAHTKHCEFTRNKIKSFMEKSWSQQQFVTCPAHMACPLNPSPETSDGSKRWEEFSECFTPAIRNVVSFAKCIPGFQLLSQEDQVTLLKAGTFEVLLVHLSCLFDTQSNTMMFTNGKLFKRSSLTTSNCAGFLLDSMFDFSDRMNQMNLTDEEVALFSAIVIIASDRPGLRNLEQVERVQTRITQGLQKLMSANHPEDSALFAKLLMKIPDLRTLNTLHSEKLLGLTVPAGTSAKPQNNHKVKPSHEKASAPFLQGMLPPAFPLYPPQLMGGHSQDPGIPYPPRPPEVPPMSAPIAGSSHSNGMVPGTYPPFHPFSSSIPMPSMDEIKKLAGQRERPEETYAPSSQPMMSSKPHSPRSTHGSDMPRSREDVSPQGSRLHEALMGTRRSSSEMANLPVFPPGLNPMINMHQFYGREPPAWLTGQQSRPMGSQEPGPRMTMHSDRANMNEDRHQQRKRSLVEEHDLTKFSRLWDGQQMDVGKSHGQNNHKVPMRYFSQPPGGPRAPWRAVCPFSQASPASNTDTVPCDTTATSKQNTPQLDLPVLKNVLSQPPLSAQQQWLPWQQSEKQSPEERKEVSSPESGTKPPASPPVTSPSEPYMLHKKLKMKRRSSSECSTPDDGGKAQHQMSLGSTNQENMLAGQNGKLSSGEKCNYSQEQIDQGPPVLNEVYEDRRDLSSAPCHSPPRLSPITQLNGHSSPEPLRESPRHHYSANGEGKSTYPETTQGEAAYPEATEGKASYPVTRESNIAYPISPECPATSGVPRISPIVAQDYDKLHLDVNGTSELTCNRKQEVNAERDRLSNDDRGIPRNGERERLSMDERGIHGREMPNRHALNTRESPSHLESELSAFNGREHHSSYEELHRISSMESHAEPLPMKHKLKDGPNGIHLGRNGEKDGLQERLNGMKDSELKDLPPMIKTSYPGGNHPPYVGYPPAFHPALVYQYNQYAAMHQQLAHIQHMQMAQLAQAQLYAACDDSVRHPPTQPQAQPSDQDRRESKDSNENSIPPKNQPLNLTTDKIKGLHLDSELGPVAMDHCVKQEPVM